MKKGIIGMLFFLILLVILGTSPVCADPLDISGSATVNWDGLTIVTSPGLQITWLGNTYQTNVHYVPGASAEQSSSDWVSPLSVNVLSGGLTESAAATADTLTSNIAWSVGGSGGFTQVMFSRMGDFLSEGSGTATFSIDYSLALTVAGSGVVPGQVQNLDTFAAEAAMHLWSLPNSNAIATSLAQLEQISSNVDVSRTQAGVLTFQRPLVSGTTYRFNVEGDEVAIIHITTEPSTMLLLGSGLLGLFGLRRKFRK